MRFFGFFARKSERFTLEIFISEYEYICKCVMEFHDVETGGDLFGLWDNLANPSIHYVLGPGPNVRRSSTSFYQDKNFLIAGGDILINKYALRHIGEWHSHHKLGLNEPSSGDINTIKRAFNNPKYNLNRFMLIICNIVGDEVILNPYIFYRSEPDFEEIKLMKCEVQFVDNVSPTRLHFNEKHNEFLYKPRGYESIFETNVKTRMKPIEELGEKAEFPQGSWLEIEGGKKYLKLIVDELKAKIDEVKIFPNDEGSVFLEISLNGLVFIVNFPSQFPIKGPYIVPKGFDNNKKVKDVNSRFKWEHKTNPSVYILNCMKLFTKPNERIIEIE